MNTFSTYQAKTDTLSMEDFLEIHRKMTETIGNDPAAAELIEELMEPAIAYTAIRANWTLMSWEEKREADEGRTMKHDALIVKFNKLARYLDMTGRDISWRADLGYTEDKPENRRRIGDFACWLVFIAGINAR